jgi:hypothetical protein
MVVQNVSNACRPGRIATSFLDQELIMTLNYDFHKECSLLASYLIQAWQIFINDLDWQNKEQNKKQNRSLIIPQNMNQRLY